MQTWTSPGNKPLEPEKKKLDPTEAVVYSEVWLMTPQEKQQKQEHGEG